MGESSKMFNSQKMEYVKQIL